MKILLWQYCGDTVCYVFITAVNAPDLCLNQCKMKIGRTELIHRDRGWNSQHEGCDGNLASIKLNNINPWWPSKLLLGCKHEIPYPFPVRQFKFGNEKVISFHTLLGMWVLVHAEISVDLCSLKWRVFNTSVTRFRSKWSGSLFIGDDRCLRHITEPCSVVSVADNSAVEDYTIQLNVIIVVI